MAIRLIDLADKLNVKVADLRDYIDFLDLDVPKSALEVSEEKAKILEQEIAKDIDGERPDEVVEDEEKEKVVVKETDQAKQVEEEIEEEMQRKIVDQQRKMTAGKKEGKKRKKSTVQTPAKATAKAAAKAKKGNVAAEPEAGAATDTGVAEAAVRKATEAVEIPDVVSVNEFAQRTGIPVARVIGELMKNGILATINQKIDYDTAAIIASNFSVKVMKKKEAVTVEQVMAGDLSTFLKEEDKANLVARPPVVVVMGHVDHGKTSVLDAIRHSDVAAGEAGGITQHIGAYQITHLGKRITFLDTPGHESFSAMRARGARVTDIAVLIVAADEGVMPQTIEAYHHAKAAHVSVIVAINKIDKEGADPTKVKNELAQKLEIPLEEWGGDVPVVELSAITGKGIDDLLDHILLLADLHQYKANPNREAIGTVIESHLDKNLGPIATIIVNTGTLQLMDNVVIGKAHGRVKRMMDHKGKTLKAVGPSGPVQIAGLSEVPLAGDLMFAVKDEKTARGQASRVATKRRAAEEKTGIAELISLIKQGKIKVLKMMVKADTKGSLEAILSSLEKLKGGVARSAVRNGARVSSANPSGMKDSAPEISQEISGRESASPLQQEVATQVIHSGIGAVTSNDVNMAAISGAVIFAFHVSASHDVKRLADQLKVEIREITIIYKLLEEVQLILEGLLDPEIVEVELGEAKVLKIFLAKRKEMIVGLKVQKGKLVNKGKIRIIRNGQMLGLGDIDSLQREQEKVSEVAEGYECGIKYQGQIPLAEGDILQAFVVEKRKRKL